jgi:predicted glycosyltransferase
MPLSNLETFIIVQHSIGIGHLTRCFALARALSSISHVTLFDGGKPAESHSPPPGVDFVQMPVLYRPRAGEFPAPVDTRYTLAETEQMRGKLLVDAYRRLKPRIIITEYFPFAPRRFGATTLNELFRVISEEPPAPLVICSIRTVPREEAPDIDEDPTSINAYLKKAYSFVLHHADPKLFPLSSLGSFEQRALSGIPVWQTGFVRRPFAQTNRNRVSNGLLLTIGGGSSAGAKLLKRWIEAARDGSPDLLPLVAVCGPLTEYADRKAIHAERAPNVIVHDWVTNMDDLISSSRAVVCLGGYNTPLEALSQNKPVLAFPHSGLGDQVFQVTALHARGVLLKGDPSQSNRDITTQMNKLLNFRPKYQIDCTGAERSVEIIRRALTHHENAR